MDPAQRELRTLTLFLPDKYSGTCVEVVDHINYLHPMFWFKSSKHLDKFCVETGLTLDSFSGTEGIIKLKHSILTVHLESKTELIDKLESGIKLVVMGPDRSPRFYTKKY